MRTRSETWEKLARHGDFFFDVKARINQKDYVKISAPKIDRSLMSAPLSVGNCISAMLDLSVLTDDDIPQKDTEIIILGRLVSKERDKATGWEQFGTFYIDQRDTSFEGLITVKCYDSLLKANQGFLGEDDTGTWPRRQIDVVQEIAYRIGVGIDPRTAIRTGPDYIVTQPTGKSMKDVLGYIGACHGGNWIITEENLLRLVPLTTAPDETFRVIDKDWNTITLAGGDHLAYRQQEIFNAVLPAPSGEHPDSLIPRTYYITDEAGNRIVTPEGYYLIWDTETSSSRLEVTEGLVNVPVVCGNISTGPRLTVTRIRITDETGNEYTAGDDSGTTLEIEGNPYATQGICNDLYAAYNGLVYLPYTATKALYDPATELGDQVKIGDMVHSVLYDVRLTLDHNFRADMSAPNSEELTSEYPYLTTAQKVVTVERQVQSTAAEVEKVSVNLEKTDNAITAEVSRAQEAEAGLRVYVDSIELSVSNYGTSSYISLKAGDAVISSQNITMFGYVKFSDLSTSGSTTITGDNVTTGTINAGQVKFYYADSNGDGGGVSVAYGLDGNGNTTYGAKLYGADSRYYVIATNSGVRMQAVGTSLYCVDGAIRATSAVVTTSDRKMKHTITYGMERYEELFQLLKPAYFKMVDGYSDRFHTGFIAQDVEDALLEVGLTTKDFAALVKSEDAAQGGGTYTAYGLRYSEFTALNTYMTQKALRRIEELERKIARLGGHLT